jgi:diacylglycerol kinase
MTKLIKGFGFAIQGIRHCFATEFNFRIHITVTILVITGGVYYQISSKEWIILAWSICGVLAFELLNTAVEKLCNLVYPGHHEGIGKIKDMAAAAVLLSSLAAAISGVIIFLPKIFLSLF